MDRKRYNSDEAEELMTRRLCMYLDLTVETIRDRIVIYPTAADWKKDFVNELVYETFHDALFDEYPYKSLSNMPEWKSWVRVWDNAVRKAFNFSSLEELELQLSVRGF